MIFQYLFLYSLCSSLFWELREWSHEKFAILNPKPWSYVRILIYRTWAIEIIHEKGDVFAAVAVVRTGADMGCV